MENKKYIGMTIIALIVALGSIGYNISNQTYFCESRGIVMECARFSESELRCYPSLTSKAGYRDCKEGWKKVEDVVEQPNFAKEIYVNANGKDWICDIKEGKVDSYTKCYSNEFEAYLGEIV